MKPTAWDIILDDGAQFVDEPDVRSAIYPKKVKVSKRVNPTDLPNLPTRVLMQYLKVARIHGDYNVGGRYHLGGPFIPLAAIKAELAKRPHVPNRAEARAQRQVQAKSKQRSPKPRKLPEPTP